MHGQTNIMLSFGWQIRVTPYEHVLRSTLKLCWWIWRHWRIFFRSHIILHFILQHASKVKIAHLQIWQVKPPSPAYYSVTETLRLTHRIVCYFSESVSLSVDFLVGKGIGSLVIGQVRMTECVLRTCVNLWYHKNKMVLIIQVALVAHHRPTITSCSGGLMWDFLQTSNCFSES